MLYFFTTFAIGHLPPFDLYCVFRTRLFALMPAFATRLRAGHIRAIRCQTLRDGSANPARPAGNRCNLSVQFLSHCFSPAPRISLSLAAEIDCPVGCGGAPLATYFVKLAPMLCEHGSWNGAATSSIFCCDCRSRKSDGGRRAKASHVTAIAQPADS